MTTDPRLIALRTIRAAYDEWGSNEDSADVDARFIDACISALDKYDAEHPICPPELPDKSA